MLKFLIAINNCTHSEWFRFWQFSAKAPPGWYYERVTVCFAFVFACLRSCTHASRVTSATVHASSFRVRNLKWLLPTFHQDKDLKGPATGKKAGSPVNVDIAKVIQITTAWVGLLCHHGFTVLSLYTVWFLGKYRVGFAATTSLRTWCVFCDEGGSTIVGCAWLCGHVYAPILLFSPPSRFVSLSRYCCSSCNSSSAGCQDIYMRLKQ